MRVPPFEQAQSLQAFSNIRHGFFGRQGAQNPALGLDMSEKLSGELPRISANRAAALSAIGARGMALASLKQIHSCHVVTLDTPPDPDARPQGDGLVSNRGDIVLGILSADCTPVLFADPENRVIGACHAGWRGAVGGILENTLAAMVAIGARAEKIVAAIGPTISGVHYEVGPDFANRIEAQNPHTAAHIFVPDGAERAHFDLPGFVRAELLRGGIERIEKVGGCTFADPARYFSHRHHLQQASPAGRQISLIGLLDPV